MLIGSFIPESRRRSVSLESQKLKCHVKFLKDFAFKFAQNPIVKNSLLDSRTDDGVNKAFTDYLGLLKKGLDEDTSYTDFSIYKVMEEVETYITKIVHQYIFPSKPTLHDLSLYQKTVELGWVDLAYLKIEIPCLYEDAILESVKFLWKLEETVTPVEKLKCFTDFLDCLSYTITLLLGSNELSIDDMIPYFIFTLIKAKPRRLYSHINFTNKFRDPDKLKGQEGYCLKTLEVAAEIIKDMKHGDFDLEEQEYE